MTAGMKPDSNSQKKLAKQRENKIQNLVEGVAVSACVFVC